MSPESPEVIFSGVIVREICISFSPWGAGLLADLPVEVGGFRVTPRYLNEEEGP